MAENVYRYRHSVFGTVVRSGNPHLGAEWVPEPEAKAPAKTKTKTTPRAKAESKPEPEEDLIGED